MPEIVKVTEPEAIDSVAALAHEIWNQHYVDIVGQPQVDYMLGKFQSARAIAEQIAAGYHYYIVMDRGRKAGYFALLPRPEDSSAQLSKIYVKRELRRRGLGKAIMAFVDHYCASESIRELWLTVNRHNTGSIAFYEHMGFANTGPLVQDIGSGFVMDDYRMVKIIERTSNPDDA